MFNFNQQLLLVGTEMGLQTAVVWLVVVVAARSMDHIAALASVQGAYIRCHAHGQGIIEDQESRTKEEFKALLEEYLRCRLKVGHIPKVCLVEVGEPNIRRAKLLLKHGVYILAMFRRIREAAGIAKPRRLLDRRGYRSGRRCGLSDSVVDLTPDKRIV